MTAISLYQLTDEMQQLEDIICANDGEMTEEVAEAFDNTLAAIGGKVDAYCALMRKFADQVENVDKEIKRLQTMKKVCKNADAHLRARLLAAMEDHGITKLEGTTCKVSIRSNPWSLTVDEEALSEADGDAISDVRRYAAAHLPSYYDVDLKVSKTAIKNAFPREGNVLPAGCEYTQGQSLTIK